MGGIPVKNHGKKYKVFLKKPKWIRVKLRGSRWKTFLANWIQNNVDENMERKTGSSLWILHDTGYDGGRTESTALRVRVPYHQVFEWITKMV